MIVDELAVTPRRDGARLGVVRGPARSIGVVTAMTLSASGTGVIIGSVARSLAHNRMAPWILARAAGITSYLLLLTLVLLGMSLSAASRDRRRRTTIGRIRVHVTLAALTLAFTVGHVVALATDTYAGVGWRGVFVPMGASYRPVATTLGVIGLWSGLIAGVTAALAGRLPRRLWWPIHKVAAVSLVLVWFHGLLGGSDSVALRWMYLSSGSVVLLVAAFRYRPRGQATSAVTP